MCVSEQADPDYSRLNELLEGIPGVFWEFQGCPGESSAHLVYISPGMKQIFGDADLSSPSALAAVIASVHPDDVLRTRRRMVEVYTSRGKGSVRCRCIRETGDVVWLDVRMAAVTDETGAAIGLRGMAVDVSDQVRTEESLRQRETEFRNLAENAPDIIARFDREARHIYVNRALCRATRVSSEAILGRTHTELGLPPGNAEKWEFWVRTVLSTGYERVETFEQSDERGRRYYHARIIPERNRDGEVESVLTIARDLSDQRRAEEIQAFLGMAGERLSATLDYGETIATVSELAVPLLGDLCAVDLINQNGVVERVAEYNIDPDATARARELVGPAPFDADAEIGVPLTIRTGQSEFVPLVNDEWLESVGASRRLAAVLKSLGIQSLLTTALSTRGKIIGSMTFAMTTSGRHFTRDDVLLAEVLSGRCAQAIDNANLYRQVEQMNRSKDEFIAMLGHELRNPLAAISNAVMAVRSQFPEFEGPLSQAHSEITRQIGVMVRLVDDLLDASRITHGQIRLFKEPMDASEAVFRAVTSLEAQASEKRLQVVIEVPKAVLPISADPMRIQQILTNLLRNAIDYTPPGGRIRVIAESNGDTVTIRFVDNGKGMDADLVPRVFDLLVQGTHNLDRNDAGLGIGLSLVKSLVELHGGNVEAHSEGPGKGSVFVVNLPLDATRPMVRSETEPWKPEAASRSLSILLADDNVVGARMLAEVLGALGHEVRIAEDGETAIELALKSMPDVALVDIGLPGIDGYEVARRLRAEPSFSRVRIIAVTGYGGRDDRRRSLEAGFDEHLVKPVDYRRLEKLLSEIPEGGEQ